MAPLTPRRAIAKLVGFDTVSHRSNLALIDWTAAHLGALGARVRVLPDASGQKANLIASFGPKAAGGVVLSGHSDVAPVDGQDWDSDPFKLVERDGRLFGRGAADMKSFIAVVIALAPEFLARTLRTPIHLALSHDEEVGCIGAKGMMPTFADPDLRPCAVIVGEPTSMRVCNAHKGVHAFRTTVTGLEAHSSRTHAGVNAIVYAARMIGLLERLAAEQRAAAQPESGFDPPYTTIQIGRVQGGTALNIVPRHCAFDWETRPMPGADVAALTRRVDDFANSELAPEMRAVFPGADISTKDLLWIPALAPETGSRAESLALRLAGANAAYVASYGAEAGLFQQGGYAVVICGPGDIAQAHRPNEYITLAQVDACVAFMRRLMDWAERA